MAQLDRSLGKPGSSLRSFNTRLYEGLGGIAGMSFKRIGAGRIDIELWNADTLEKIAKIETDSFKDRATIAYSTGMDDSCELSKNAGLWLVATILDEWFQR